MISTLDLENIMRRLILGKTEDNKSFKKNNFVLLAESLNNREAAFIYIMRKLGDGEQNEGDSTAITSDTGRSTFPTQAARATPRPMPCAALLPSPSVPPWKSRKLPARPAIRPPLRRRSG